MRVFEVVHDTDRIFHQQSSALLLGSPLIVEEFLSGGTTHLVETLTQNSREKLPAVTGPLCALIYFTGETSRELQIQIITSAYPLFS